MSEQPDEDAFEETADDVHAPRDEPLDDAVDVEPGPEDVLADDLSGDGGAPGPAATGHPAVDEVLRSLEGLDGRPVDEHVAAYEQAHDQLRRALSDAGDDTP